MRTGSDEKDLAFVAGSVDRRPRLLAPEEKMRDAARTRNRFELEPTEQVVVALPKTFAFARVEWRDGDVHFIDEIFFEKFAHRCNSPAYPNIHFPGRFLGDPQRLLWTRVDEVKRRVTEGDGWSDKVRQHEDGRMEWRIVAPPSLPLLVLPRPALRPEFVSAHDFGADVSVVVAQKVVVETSTTSLVCMKWVTRSRQCPAHEF